MRSREFEKVRSAEFESILTPALISLGEIFNKNKHEIRVVGGAVRDLMLGKKPKDIDLATDATPKEMMEFLEQENIKVVPTGIEHGTITAVINKEPYEITTLRADTETDGRKAKVNFIRNWREDARRRDLTYNAMSLDFEGRLYDYFEGMNDLQNKVSRFVGDPNERIQEDYLRILRYFRFQSKLSNPQWSSDTLDAIQKNASMLKKISVERVWQEIQKMLVGDSVIETLKYMKSTGVAEAIGLSTDNMDNLQNINYKLNPIIGLALLVGDESIANRWKMSKNERDLLSFLVKHKNENITEQTAKDMIVDGIPKHYVMFLLEMLGKKDLVNKLTVFTAPAFPVAGKDLLAIGMKPGPQIGEIITKLQDIWKQSNYEMSKEELLKQIKND